ncbi:PREDICTED: telethonin-like [Cyprinodon variegatus]|uniref:Telethonin-like n=1 Tax=Cyprinodon variegatus TaxID=28743 RepID=A0A3Q2CCI6_CYPVA|nr:PREDICTED: telethonin-like [Cyprinodon variegatus]
MHCVSRGGSYLVNSYCDLQEDNLWKKESYISCWLNVVLETRPQYRLTLSETDRVRRESYKQQQVVHLMVQRSPNQTLKLGRERGVMTEFQLPLSTCTVLPARRNITAGKEETSAKTQDLCKPVRGNFRASGLMSSPREVSHRVPRRE